tara:strand:- start:1030 stop:1791 length:762 start_codon:yes stop_codon:yes gene_type:complete
MKFSIITAVFNRESTICRALQSIKDQTYSDIESVVIDGSSTDQTIELIKSTISKNDTFVTEKDNGIYEALNKGIIHSSGEIIGFLHSDDIYFDTNVISKVSEIFLDETIDIVFGDTSYFKKDNLNKIVRMYRSNELSLKNLAWGKMPSHTAMFVRKNIFNKYGLFDTSYLISGDYEFLCRIMRNGKIKSIHVPNTFIKMQVGGASTQGLKSKIIINKEVMKACRDNKIYTNIFMVISKYPSKLMQFFLKKEDY